MIMGVFDILNWVWDRIFAPWWPFSNATTKQRKTKEICSEGHETTVPKDKTENFYTVGYWSEDEMKWIIGTPFTTRLYFCAGCKTYVPSK